MNDDYSHLSWRETGRELRAKCGVFDLYSVTRKDIDNRTGTFTLLDAPDWVTIIPRITMNGVDTFIMVRQYRHGLGGLTLEFPAGVSENGEHAGETARRELLEETGYQAGALEYLGDICPNPAFMNNSVYTYLATDLKLVQGQELDEHEMVDVVPVPVDEVIRDMGKPPYGSGIMMIALAWYLRR